MRPSTCVQSVRATIIPLAVITMTMLAAAKTADGNQAHNSSAFHYRRLAGRWFQLAHRENKHEQDLGNVVAIFAPQSNGAIRFNFRGNKNYGNGKRMSLKGTARTDPRYPGRFTVTFYGIFSRTFEVVDFDRENYQYAILADESRDCFWLLSRKPEAGDRLYKRFGEIALREGIDLNLVCRTPQDVPNYAQQ